MKRYVLWPGGAVVHGDRLFVAMGVDDTYCRIMSFSLEEVDDAMRDIPTTETGRTTGISQTVIAKGIRSDHV